MSIHHASDGQPRSHNLRIAVVGGGLGGLSFALACLRQGIVVDVYEQATAFREIGNGLALQPNAARLINNQLGLEDEFARISASLVGETYLAYADYRTGETVSALQSSGAVHERSHRVPRSEMLDILRAPLDPNRLHTAKKLVKLNKEEHFYRLHFADGTEVDADLVVAADGIHSSCRRYLQDTYDIPRDNPVYGGQVVYRALVPREMFSVDMQDILFRDQRACTFRGPYRHFLVFAAGEKGKLLNVVAFIPEERDENSSESWTARGDVSELQRELTGWCKPVQAVVQAMSKMSHDCMKQALYYRQPLQKWHDGNLVLLGDAAHAILPHQGQGTGMAVEDAVALALLLRNAKRPSLPYLLQAYQEVRKPRTDAMLAASIAMGKVSSSPNADNEISAHDRQMMSERDWIWNYDLVSVIEAKIARLPSQMFSAI